MLPTLAVIGSGMHAVSIISSFSECVALRRIRIVWVLPNRHRAATVFDGCGWSSTSSVQFDPFHCTLGVAQVISDNVDKITPAPGGLRGGRIYAGGCVVNFDALIVALDPLADMQDAEDDFRHCCRTVQPHDDSSYLRNHTDLTLNMLTAWQMESLRSLLQTSRHRKYIQASIGIKREKKGPRDADEDEVQDDDDDMEIDRPNVIDLRLPLATTTFAAALMESSRENIPQLLYFAMNEGERTLPLQGKGMSDAELERVCDALRLHYSLRGPNEITFCRDVSEIDISSNRISTVSPITKTFVFDGVPVRSMLRTLTVSDNKLEKATVVELLRALIAADEAINISTLKFSNCGLDDEVGDLLAIVVAKTKSLRVVHVGLNNFTAPISQSILLSSRHHLEEISLHGVPLSMCSQHILKLLYSKHIQSIDFSACDLDDQVARSIGNALVSGPNKEKIRKLDLSNNPKMTTEAVRFLFECLSSLGEGAMSEFFVKGCGPLGIHEIGFASTAVQVCRNLSKLSLSLIAEEQLCAEVLITTIVKGSNVLELCDFDLREDTPSRCDSTVASPTHATLSKEQVDRLEAKLEQNRTRKESRREELAGRSLSVATALDAAADAARAIPNHNTVTPLFCLRIDDSATRNAYQSQLSANLLDRYRFERLEFAYMSVCGKALPPTVGYKCGSVCTFDEQWKHFSDVTVVLKRPTLPLFLTNLNVKVIDGAALVTSEFELSTPMNIFMIGCGSRQEYVDAPFSLAVNSGVFWSFLSTIVLKRVYDRVLRLLCPELRCSIPRNDAIGVVMQKDNIALPVLRQKIIEIVSLPFVSSADHAAMHKLKFVFEELCRRYEEEKPFTVVNRQCLSREDLRSILEGRGIDDPTNKAKAAEPAGTKTEEKGSKKDANPAPPPPPPVSHAPLFLSPDLWDVAVEWLREAQRLSL